ncbi:RDD family protein [Actinoplanes sp. NPDC023714]|uniref:RDD family protein n=1 Tax=Actinoplanes sp. NPDC023714 TaxID=3154322 RepID=UPI0033FB33A3
MTTAVAEDYAGLVSRTLAYGADAFIVALLTGGSATVFSMIASVVGPWARDLGDLVVSSYLIFLPSIMAVYCALFWLLAGRTPGMAVLGLRVVRVDGSRLHWLAALLRAVLLAYFPIGALWLIVDRKYQGLPDKVARTTVIRVEPSGRGEVAPEGRIAR